MTVRKSLTDRVRAALARTSRVVEKKMFGGVTFMVDGKMCISAGRHRLMCRIGPELHDSAVRRKGVQTVRMKGHTYRGFVHVREEVVTTKRALDYWVRACLAFNNRAKSSK